MEHDHAAHHRHETTNVVTNYVHQHAFTIVGDAAVFGVHMTQYHHEEHKYQLVMKVVLPPEVKSELDTVRARFPSDTFMLCNTTDDLFMIPDLPSRRRTRFRANIFQGLPDFSHEESESPHFFPWDEARTKALIERFEVEVERIVTFRPFAHHLKQPDFATYLLWGEGDEAHMTSLQTARQASGPFEVPAFGPDYDHVMSLKAAPDWLDAPLLEAGVPVSVPAIRLNDAETGRPSIPVGVPIEEGAKLTVLYRGTGEPRTVVAGRTPLAGTGVCNSEGMVECTEEDALVMSKTPERLMR